MTPGSTPKQIRSLSESICTPKRFSWAVRSMVEAIFPSNISHKPARSRHKSAQGSFPPMAKPMPVRPVSIPMYVKITV